MNFSLGGTDHEGRYTATAPLGYYHFSASECAFKFIEFNVTEPGSLGVWALFCTALVLKINAAHRESNTGILPKGVAHCAMAPGQAFPVDFSSI